MKQTDRLSADSLIKMCKIIFLEYGLLIKTMSDPGTICFSERFQEFCRYLNIHQAISSLSYNHQSNWQAEVCEMFITCTMKKCFDTNNDVYLDIERQQNAKKNKDTC